MNDTASFDCLIKTANETFTHAQSRPTAHNSFNLPNSPLFCRRILRILRIF